MPGDHVQGARPDRPGRAEYRDVLNRAHLMKASTASGSIATGASMRSRTPPCPGRRLPLSFTPAWRFIRDSNRSPMIPTTARPSRTAASHCEAAGALATQLSDPSAFHASAYTATATRAPATPSHVLPGLIDGASFRLPKRLPTKYAAESEIHTVPRTP